MVYVLNTDGKALMPTRRHHRVRQLLKKGEAVVVCCYPFTIKLTTEKPRFVQEISLGVDSGTRHIGVSATTCKEVMYSAEAILRKDIPDLTSLARSPLPLGGGSSLRRITASEAYILLKTEQQQSK